MRIYSTLTDAFLNDIFDLNQSQSKYHISDKDDKYVLRILAAGIEKENININISSDTLHVNLKEKIEDDFKLVTNLDKSFTLPNDVDYKKIESKLELGILTITLYKSEEKNFKIDIK